MMKLEQFLTPGQKPECVKLSIEGGEYDLIPTLEVPAEDVEAFESAPVSSIPVPKLNGGETIARCCEEPAFVYESAHLAGGAAHSGGHGHWWLGRRNRMDALLPPSPFIGVCGLGAPA
jgi:hypothetical protein